MGKFQGVMTATTPTGIALGEQSCAGGRGRVHLARWLAGLTREVAQDGGRPAGLADALPDGLALFPGEVPADGLGAFRTATPLPGTGSRRELVPGVAAQAGNAARAAAAAARRCSAEAGETYATMSSGRAGLRSSRPGVSATHSSPMRWANSDALIRGWYPDGRLGHDETPWNAPPPPCRDPGRPSASTSTGCWWTPNRSGWMPRRSSSSATASRSTSPIMSRSSAPPRCSPRCTSRVGWACRSPRPSASGWSTSSWSRAMLQDGEIPIQPGARELLARLRGRVPIALATNTRRSLADVVLERTGLAGLFDAIATSDEAEAQAGARPVPARMRPAGRRARARGRSRGLAHRGARRQGGRVALHLRAIRAGLGCQPCGRDHRLLAGPAGHGSGPMTAEARIRRHARGDVGRSRC